MHFSPLVFAVASIVSSSINVLAWDTTTSASGSPTCVTITETTGSSCPTPTGICVRPDCLEIQTITLECGCASIFSTTSCETTCGHGCGTSYDTIYLPCATSFSSPSSTPPVSTTTTSTSCSTTSSSSVISPPPTTSLPGSSTIYPNSTITSTATSSTIVTITSCPASVTCTGQTTTWSGTSGPSSCSASSTCSCVLPGGGGTQTVTQVTVTTPGKTGPTPTASSVGGATPVQANEGANVGRFGLVEGGVLIGLIGAVVGML